MEKYKITIDDVFVYVWHLVAIILTILGCGFLFLLIVKPYIVISVALVLTFVSLASYMLFKSVRTLVTEIFRELSRGGDQHS